MSEMIEGNKEPIIEFESEEQAYECLEYWKRVLFLDDWLVKLHICGLSEMKLKDCSGENEFQIVNKCCVIRLAKMNDDIRGRIQKVAHECSLVHELLHCKYNWVEVDYDKLQNAYHDVLEHSLLEQMSKSLIMARYGLDFSWFKNF